jgi:7,8-dihydropterin-6-yl-methyl-4-(beta-D-ribofuranosyl)aminobenzene 5'-phosphate synthase
MQALGLSEADFDAIVISHPHPDHLGGVAAWRSGTFTLGSQAIDLSDKPIYVPVSLSYPGANPVVAAQPALIAPGVATSGVIAFKEVFPIDLLQPVNYEQALAVNVAGHGIVLISGCGHPSLEKLVARAEALFAEPVAGIVGGLHYLTMDAAELDPHLEFLQARHPALVALSPHDSGPQVIQVFKETFGPAYQEIRIGQPVVLSNQGTLP